MTITIVAVVAVLLLVVLFRLVWRVAEPNEALIISGLGAHGSNDTSLDSLGFKIVVGRGTAVIPGFQTVRRLGLDIRATGLIVNAVSNQSIPLMVKGVVAYKVGDDLASIANAARRFLQQDADSMRATIHELFAGHLRAIVGGMSVEDMLHNREELTANIRSSLADDLSKLGLVVDSLQIQEIDDESGYIVNLGKPQAAAIAAAARIAAAERDQEATSREQAANAEKAAAVRESSIKQAGYQAEVDQAQSRSLQSGPLAEALARQEVVRAETAAAELDAARREKVLESEVRKPADAEAYRQVTLADAARQTEILRAQADREAQILRAQGEGQAIQTVFQAIHDGSPDQSLLAYQYLQMIPKIAEGDANKMWIIPSEFGKALEGLGAAVGSIPLHTDGPVQRVEVDTAPPQLTGEAQTRETQDAVAEALAAARDAATPEVGRSAPGSAPAEPPGTPTPPQ